MQEEIKPLFKLIDELEIEYGRDYILRALKIISNRQMLFLDIPEPPSEFLPILKVLEIVINEIDDIFYEIIKNDISEENSNKILSEAIEWLKQKDSPV